MGTIARGILAKGENAYYADTIDGGILRAAARQVIVQVSTVVERLPDDFKASHRDVLWTVIQRMRDEVVGHGDRVNDDFVRGSLEHDLPRLLDQLGLATEPGSESNARMGLDAVGMGSRSPPGTGSSSDGRPAR